MGAGAVSAALERDDIQGLFARGYSNLGRAAFLLLSLDGGGPRWLADVVGGITSADDRPEERAANVAFTSSGLEALGVDRATLAQFSNEFVSGMTTPHRRRILADAGESAPERWQWGGPANERVDGLLLLYAVDAAALDALVAEQTETLNRHGVGVVRRLETNDLDGFEPFGFRDGVSQPLVEGLGKHGRAEFTVRAGEFVLGYPNEYGRLTDHPPLGRNGSYLVFRQLEQDV
ncbi:MAG: peroxidase, partial [Actinomycetota bacterium]|nr:peroxidase [Actinomycetota bacterium]